MPRPKFGNEIAAGALRTLVDQRSEPQDIDHAFQDGTLKPEQLVLTSMGVRKQAIITPYYPAIQFESTLDQREYHGGRFGADLLQKQW